MKYYVAVDIVPTPPMKELVGAIQTAFDGGTAGNFQVLATRVPSYLILFERDTDDDVAFVCTRAKVDSISIEKAILFQLADELQEGGLGLCAKDILLNLENGDAKIFDFGNGALAELSAFKC